ncbi:T-cell surface glycoprotein CD3 delta chain [Emydura macquarii macquarii]|uniref:T-cell surface glycoprotein CD3 delta chain n=1 Tax=Emydura macquarii macquarii TaxID=1129001 RepID=UPI00352A7376
MGRHGYLVSVIMIGFIIKGTQTSGNKEGAIKLEKRGRDMVLTCTSQPAVWKRDGTVQSTNGSELNLGPAANDPRGVYMCDQNTLQVYFRMCHNCIELDAATISGILVADVIATVFLAIAVYCITSQDSGRLSRVSDRQRLIANEQLYQPLGERDNEPYSRLGVAKTRK